MGLLSLTVRSSSHIECWCNGSFYRCRPHREYGSDRQVFHCNNVLIGLDLCINLSGGQIAVEYAKLVNAHDAEQVRSLIYTMSWEHKPLSSSMCARWEASDHSPTTNQVTAVTTQRVKL